MKISGKGKKKSVNIRWPRNWINVAGPHRGALISGANFHGIKGLGGEGSQLSPLMNRKCSCGVTAETEPGIGQTIANCFGEKIKRRL